MERAESLQRQWSRFTFESIKVGVEGGKLAEDSEIEFKTYVSKGAATLDDTDRHCLSKTISAFANSGGGVLIWGVTEDGTPPERTLSLSPIDDVEAAKVLLEEQTSRVVTPHVAGVRHRAVARTGSSQGFVATLVPPVDLGPPVMSIVPKKGKRHHLYYIRSGSSSVELPPELAMGLFSRTGAGKLAVELNQVWISNGYVGAEEIRFVVPIWVRNVGRGPVREVSCEITLNAGSAQRHLLGNIMFNADRPVPMWAMFRYFNEQMIYVEKTAAAVHPNQVRLAGAIQVVTRNEWTNDEFELAWAVYGEGTAPAYGSELINPEDWLAHFSEYGDMPRGAMFVV